jgi:hypothetical protein
MSNNTDLFYCRLNALNVNDAPSLRHSVSRQINDHITYLNLREPSAAGVQRGGRTPWTTN